MKSFTCFWCNSSRNHRGPPGAAVFVTPPTPRSIRRARF
jgi:hypothetical protein